MLLNLNVPSHLFPDGVSRLALTDDPGCRAVIGSDMQTGGCISAWADEMASMIKDSEFILSLGRLFCSGVDLTC